jgi:outer membrane murein-binding lipoprotein Lpp
MKTRVIAVMALVIAFALVTAVSAGNPIDQVLTVVKDIQSKVERLVTSVNDIHTDVQSLSQERKCTWDLAPIPSWGNAGNIIIYINNYGPNDEVIEWSMVQNSPPVTFTSATIKANSFSYLTFSNIQSNVFRLRGSRNIGLWGIESGVDHYDMVRSGDFSVIC